jgi:hypothetical protein
MSSKVSHVDFVDQLEKCELVTQEDLLVFKSAYIQNVD